jgi:hypothetical protein
MYRHVCSLVRSECHRTAHPCLHSAVSGTDVCCVAHVDGPPLWSSDESSWLQNSDVLCFLWGTNWIYVCYVEESRPPLWSSGLSSWLQIQRSRVRSRRYQIFWGVVSFERGLLSLVTTIEELLGRKSSGSGLENRDYGRRDHLRWPRDTHYLQKLSLTLPTSRSRSVGIVRSRIEAMELSVSSCWRRGILPCYILDLLTFPLTAVLLFDKNWLQHFVHN